MLHIQNVFPKKKDILTWFTLDISNELSCPTIDWRHIQAAFPPCFHLEFSHDRLWIHPDHETQVYMESDRCILPGITHSYTQSDSSRRNTDKCTEACPVDKIWGDLLIHQTRTKQGTIQLEVLVPIHFPPTWETSGTHRKASVWQMCPCVTFSRQSRDLFWWTSNPAVFSLVVFVCTWCYVLYNVVWVSKKKQTKH